MKEFQETRHMKIVLEKDALEFEEIKAIVKRQAGYGARQEQAWRSTEVLRK